MNDADFLSSYERSRRAEVEVDTGQPPLPEQCGMVI